jgi:predicted DCC family thiol-disulfide oxidoreductase YuxK|tara:strand:- start:14 stop:430 length:417 start_codon:yes stop_codon:yes gene_type:complete
MKEKKDIVFYDGICSFCNGLVVFLLKHERRNNMSFCALQSEFAKSFLKDFDVQMNQDTIYYYYNGKLYKTSEAIKKIARNLKPPYLIISYFLAITPKFIREYFYKFFAKNRYKWFGKKDKCQIPSPEDRLRFLDILEY